MQLEPSEVQILNPLLEAAWGDIVPSWDYPANDWPDSPTGRLFPQFVTMDDRADGRCRPLYDNESDLSRHIASVRRWIGLNELTEAVTTALQVYTFGQGVEISVQAAKGKGTPPKLVEDVRRIVDKFSEDNTLVNNLDLELHRRSREDGEAIIPLEREGNKIVAEPVETIQLTAPPRPGELSNWIEQVHDIDMCFDQSWMFGVLTTKRRTARPIGYHIVYDSAGNDWDFYPADQVVHVKRNVPRSAKRGVSDWLAVRDRVAQAAKLVRNMAHGAALQAAIGWIEESPPGTRADQLNGIGNPGIGGPVPNGNGTTRTDLGKTYGPGSILRPTNGRKYLPGPMGAERNEGFSVVEEMLERLIGTRWLLPYAMISGDASNNNFASGLVAESPFVKAREFDQQVYGGALKSLLWKAVRLAWRLGWFDTMGIPVGQLDQSVDIVVNFTSPATRDRGQLIDQLVKEVGLGTTSRRTAAVELGRDLDEEIAAGAAPEGQADPATGNIIPGGKPTAPTPPGTLSVIGARAADTSMSRVVKVLTDFAAGKYSRVVAKGFLMQLSVPDDTAETYLDDAEAGKIDQPATPPIDPTKAAAIQGALESVLTEAIQIIEFK